MATPLLVLRNELERMLRDDDKLYELCANCAFHPCGLCRGWFDEEAAERCSIAVNMLRVYREWLSKFIEMIDAHLGAQGCFKGTFKAEAPT